MVMFLTSLLSLFIFSFAYNGFLMLEGKSFLLDLIFQLPWRNAGAVLQGETKKGWHGSDNLFSFKM